MAQVRSTTEIAAPRSTVWAALADLAAAPRWNPNVTGVTCDDDGAGLGSVRVCHLAGGGQIEEVVSAWEEGRHIEFAIGSHGGVRSADMGMEIAETRAGTLVTAWTDYHPAFGPLGPVIDRVVMRRQLTRMMDDALAGLKEHIENHQRQETTETTSGKETT